MVKPLDMQDELTVPLPPKVRHFARALGLSAVIYEFLRLTFIGELISSALPKRRRSTSSLVPPSTEPTDEPILESE